MNSVLLSQVSGEHYDSFTAEPQMVRIRAGNQAELNVDSADANMLQGPPVRGIYGMKGDGLLMRKIKRLTLSRAELQYTVQNVNTTNNIFRFFVQDKTPAPSYLHTFEMPAGRFDSPKKLIDDLIALLNIDPVIGNANDISWSASTLGGIAGSSLYILSCTKISTASGHPFYIDNTCSAVRRGAPLWNIQNIPVVENDALPVRYAKVSADLAYIGPMGMQYTRYIDFHSNTLTQYTKNPSASTKYGANSLVHRMWLPPWDGYKSDPATTFQPNLPSFFVDDQIPPNWTTLNIHQSLSTIDIWLTDEFGDDLFAPIYSLIVTGFNEYPGKPATLPIGTNGGLRWSLVLTTEI